tara:strand:+ start:1486 stop:1671 length:186 start_codon:yes stop_codon:yes gene_type:complete
MKAGNAVRVISSGLVGNVTRVFWRAAAGSGISYIDKVQVQHPNGMISEHDPDSLEVIDENA